MQDSISRYLHYVSDVRRFSDRTRQVYSDVLTRFSEFCKCDPSEAMSVVMVRSYEVYLLDDCGLDARTANLHLSVLSGFAKFLIREGDIQSNPVKMVSRPKMEKRLPVFYRNEAMKSYFDDTECFASEENLELLSPSDGGKMDPSTKDLYTRRLARAVISTIVSTGIRRSEVISLNVGSVDFSRRSMSVHGKGDKMREVPMVDQLCRELSLYLRAVGIVFGRRPDRSDPLFVTPTGARLYPVYVDRTVKQEFAGRTEFSGRKSPHVLRHTLATELLNDGTDLNSIKELLGHSSLAATQVYTHNSVEKLKAVYGAAHPRSGQRRQNGK